MYIQSSDGLWYKNPTLSGDDYHIICAEGEIPVLYAKYGNSKSSIDSTKAKIINRLKKIGIKIQVDDSTAEETMCLFKVKMHIAAKWDIRFYGPIPVPLEPWKVTRPALHSMFIGWTMAFSRKEILDHLTMMTPSLMIAEFVLERRIISENVIKKEENDTITRLLQKALIAPDETLTLKKEEKKHEVRKVE